MDEGQIDLWYAWPERISEPSVLEAYARLLAADEIAQWQRYRVPRVRHQYLVTRALVRSVLSWYGGHPPAAWVFRRNAYGKPAVEYPPLEGLQFNLSHAQGLVICGVTRAGQIGVDVERRDRSVEHRDLARRFFSPVEARAVEDAGGEWATARFFEFWTLKEAYIKARGMGLSIPLDRFAFTLSPGRPPRITFLDPELDVPDRWQFFQIRLAGVYQVAVAVRAAAPRPLRVCLRQSVPLVQQDPGRVLPPLPAQKWEIGPAALPPGDGAVWGQ